MISLITISSWKRNWLADWRGGGARARPRPPARGGGGGGGRPAGRGPRRARLQGPGGQHVLVACRTGDQVAAQGKRRGAVVGQLHPEIRDARGRHLVEGQVDG